jgi:hypothetical protein
MIVNKSVILFRIRFFVRITTVGLVNHLHGFVHVLAVVENPVTS